MDKTSARRNHDIDFVKGILVVGMALYHSLDYFYPSSNILRYIQFITGSFVFISGFLISHIYFKKYNMQVNRISNRLFFRGIKLIILFVLLNAMLYVLVWQAHGKHGTEMLMSVDTFYIVFISGTYKMVAFDILLPIAYSLILMGSLILLFKERIRLYIACSFILFLYCSAIYYGNQEAYNLRYITIGLCGFALGFVVEGKLMFLSKHATIIFFLFLVYALGLNWIHQYYPQYVAIIIINLMMIYLLGTRLSSRNIIVNNINLIGQYSLLSYLIQIVLLQLLLRMFSAYLYDANMVFFVFLTTNTFMLLAIALVNRYRIASRIVDKLYRLVFA